MSLLCFIVAYILYCFFSVFTYSVYKFICMSLGILNTYVRWRIYTVFQKNIPDVFRYNSRKHCRIFIIFGTNTTKKASNQKMLYFFTSPN